MSQIQSMNPAWQRFYLICTFFFSFSLSLIRSQDQFLPGTITLMTGDQLTGFIENGNPKSNAKYVLFKKTLESPVTRYTAVEAKSYQFEGSKYYVSRQVIVETLPMQVFFEYLVDGIVELYYYADPFKDRFYIEKDGELHALENDIYITQEKKGRFKRYTYEYTGYLKYLMKDAPSLFNEIEDVKFEHRDFVKITKAYHDLTCTDGTECIVYERRVGKLKDAKWKVRPVGFIGGGAAKLKMSIPMKLDIARKAVNKAAFPNFVSSEEFGGTYFNGMNSITKVNGLFMSPTLGVNFSNKWTTSIQLEANYKSISFQFNEAEIKVAYLQGSLLGVKEFNHYNKLRPYFLTGASFNFFSKYTFDRILVTNPIRAETATVNVDVLHEVGNANGLDPQTINPLVNWTWGLGGLYELPSGQEVKAEIRYDFHLARLWDGTSGEQTTLSDISTWHFQVGYML